MDTSAVCHFVAPPRTAARYATLFCVLGCALGGALQAHAQFAMQSSGTTADLRGIVNVGNGTAWASGTHGTVLRTEDAGFLWQGCATPPGAEQLDFRGIQAFDDQTAIVMSSGKGDLSRVYKTSDGCKSWKLVFTNPDQEGFFDSIGFAPQVNAGPKNDYPYASGWLLGDPVDGTFALFYTPDGGLTWIRRAQMKRDKQHVCTTETFSASPGESAFAASNQALIGSFFLPLFTSGGSQARLLWIDRFDLDYAFCHEHAASTPLPMAQGTASSGAFALGIDPTSQHLVVVGGDYTQPANPAGTAAALSFRSGFFTTYKNRYKQEVVTTFPHGYRSSVAFDAPTKTWITVGPNGTDVSTDDGKNWRPLLPSKLDEADADKQWNALSLPYVVGPHGRIGRLREDAIPVPK